MPKPRIILPNTEPLLDSIRHLPLFFLAGPILGGEDWQYDMTEMLVAAVGECVIVNPSRYHRNHPHHRYRVEGDETVYERQTDWERAFLHRAASGWDRGCIVFWLPKESTLRPRRDGSPYARDTYGELGEWRGRLRHDRTLRVAIGADPEFPGLSQIERNYHLGVDMAFEIHPSMERVAIEARDRAVYKRLPRWVGYVPTEK